MPRQNKPPVFTTLARSRNYQNRSHKNLFSETVTILTLLLLPPTIVLFTIIPPSLRLLTLLYALAINTITYLVYRHDKNIAVAGSAAGWRVSEVNLHLWALAGGWPAAFVAQRVLRHKTRKWKFLGVFWVVVVGEEILLCLMIWYLVV